LTLKKQYTHKDLKFPSRKPDSDLPPATKKSELKHVSVCHCESKDRFVDILYCYYSWPGLLSPTICSAMSVMMGITHIL